MSTAALSGYFRLFEAPANAPGGVFERDAATIEVAPEPVGLRELARLLRRVPVTNDRLDLRRLERARGSSPLGRDELEEIGESRLVIELVLRHDAGTDAAIDHRQHPVEPLQRTSSRRGVSRRESALVQLGHETKDGCESVRHVDVVF